MSFVLPLIFLFHSLGGVIRSSVVVALSLLFSGGKHFGRRLTTVLQANPRKEGLISRFVRFSYDNVLISAQIISTYTHYDID